MKRTQPRKKKYSRSNPRPVGKGAKEDRKQWRQQRDLIFR